MTQHWWGAAIQIPEKGRDSGQRAKAIRTLRHMDKKNSQCLRQTSGRNAHMKAQLATFGRNKNMLLETTGMGISAM